MQAEPIRAPLGRGAERNSARPHPLANPSLDLPGPVPLRKSYIVASTPRGGGAFLCTRLWATGVLGAPAEYFGRQKQFATKMMERLKASSPADYLGKLLGCRTSKNGIFGINLEFNDFDDAGLRFPGMLDALAPVTYIHIDRQDQVVQAAFMAKSLQTDALRYDRDSISKWLGRIEREKIGWMRWFEGNGIVPFIVNYEKLITNPAAVVQSIVALLGVENDERQTLRVALAERPSDRISAQWAARFEREIRSGIESGEPTAAAAPGFATGEAKHEPKAPHLFDRYNEINGIPAGSIAAKRLRRRHEAIVAHNRELFKGAQVLDLHSSDGCWSLAALDAGAAHVVGIEGRQKVVAAAEKTFSKIGVNSAAYEFLNKTVFEALSTLSPEAFDLILCREVSSDPHFFFKCLRRLMPKHVVLDTKIVDRTAPVVVFSPAQQAKDGLKEGRRSELAPRYPQQRAHQRPVRPLRLSLPGGRLERPRYYRLDRCQRLPAQSASYLRPRKDSTAERRTYILNDPLRMATSRDASALW